MDGNVDGNVDAGTHHASPFSPQTPSIGWNIYEHPVDRSSANHTYAKLIFSSIRLGISAPIPNGRTHRVITSLHFSYLLPCLLISLLSYLSYCGSLSFSHACVTATCIYPVTIPCKAVTSALEDQRCHVSTHIANLALLVYNLPPIVCKWVSGSSLHCRLLYVILGLGLGYIRSAFLWDRDCNFWEVQSLIFRLVHDLGTNKSYGFVLVLFSSQSLLRLVVKGWLGVVYGLPLRNE